MFNLVEVEEGVDDSYGLQGGTTTSSYGDTGSRSKKRKGGGTSRNASTFPRIPATLRTSWLSKKPLEVWDRERSMCGQALGPSSKRLADASSDVSRGEIRCMTVAFPWSLDTKRSSTSQSCTCQNQARWIIAAARSATAWHVRRGIRRGAMRGKKWKRRGLPS